MSASPEVVERLARLVGIPGEYTDAFGQPVSVDIARRASMLGHLGYGADTEAAAQRQPGEAGRPARRARAARGRCAESGRPAASAARRATRAGGVSWRLVDEGGTARSGRSGAGTTLALPLVGVGIPSARGHQPAAVQRRRHDRGCAGRGAGSPAGCATAVRAWGLAAQIYAFRTEWNLGIGSYADVKQAVLGAAPLGASFLGLSPVHALFSADRTKISPYSPSSRLFLETIHIDPKAIAGFAGSQGAHVFWPSTRPRISAMRDLPLVDHHGVWAELSPILEALWAERERTNRTRVSRRFGANSAPSLRSARHLRGAVGAFSRAGQVVARRLAGGVPARPGGDAVQRFGHGAQGAGRLPRLAAIPGGPSARRRCGNTARGAGMSVGLYRDLAVGSDRGGSELWSNPERFGLTLSIGAPPDLLAPQGQDWGLAAPAPDGAGGAGARGLPRARRRQHAPRGRDPHRPRVPACSACT